MSLPPAPDSPEARAAARKIRDGFFILAALNLVFFAIVMCSGRKTPPPPAPAPPATAPAPE